MFRSKRSGLVRRLWRSRLVTYREGRDGSKRSVEEGRDGSSCGSTSSNPEDVPQAERRSVTQADPSVGSSGGGVCAAGGNVTQRQDDPGAIMCAPEHRGSRQGQESDSGTVTCCLFREWDLSRPRKQQQGAPTNSPKCPAATTRTRLDGIKSHNEGVEQQELKNATYALLKRLKEKALDALLKAVESKGGIPGECVLVPAAHTELRLHNSSSGAHHHHHHHHPSPISPQHLLCKVYRWADLQHTAQLKALWLCHSHSALSVDGTSPPATVCCNPYHYSRVCGPESPPPPYSLSPSDEHKPLDPTLSYTETVAPHYSNSPQIMPRDYTDTGTSLGSTTSSGRRSHWCSVAYWEQRTRVGRLYPAHEPSLSIFYDLPQGTGLCLGQLHTNSHQSHQDNVGNNSAQSLRGNRLHGSGSASGGGVQQIRSKIGYGIVLSREPDGVWVYNRSQHPVFVHSPTLDLPSARGLGLCVKRVMPGYSLKVFDYERSSWIVEHGVKPECQEGPWDPHSVRISFAKGWGPCYSRQFITSCPCWLEVLLNNHR